MNKEQYMDETKAKLDSLFSFDDVYHGITGFTKSPFPHNQEVDRRYLNSLDEVNRYHSQLTSTQHDALVSEICLSVTPKSAEYIWLKSDTNAALDQWLFQKEYVQWPSAAVHALHTMAASTHNDQTALKIAQVATYYMYDDYPWGVSSEVAQSFRDIVDSVVLRSGFSNEKLAQLFLADVIKPSIFASDKHRFVSESGRSKKVQTNIRQDIGVDDVWRSQNQHLLSMFEFCIRNLNNSELVTEWAFLAPTILNLIDDHEIAIKAKGCLFLRLLSENIDKNSDNIFSRSGLIPVFKDSVTNCLLYLPPSVSSSYSVVILSQAFPALCELALRQPDELRRDVQLDELIRQGILKGMSQSSSDIKLGLLFLQQLDVILDLMGVKVVRHLKPLIFMFLSILSDPFAAAYLPYLQKACAVLCKLMDVGKPRIYNYRYDILRGAISAWNTLNQEEVTNENVKLSVTQIVTTLKTLASNRETELKKDLEALVVNDSSLTPLLLPSTA